mmetsp:Transcript_66810/g.201701  ORF Transcript_66810/g.201701 Transcript_66810/m.201701 type:complete len:544 (+) Transcript_66810:79-1710(+)
MGRAAAVHTLAVLLLQLRCVGGLVGGRAASLSLNHRRQVLRGRGVERPSPGVSVDLVVSATNGSLGWLDSTLQALPAAKLWLYCKGDASQDPRCIRTDSTVSDENTILTHIVERYEDLAKITIFVSDKALKLDDSLKQLVSNLGSPEQQLSFKGILAKIYYPVYAKYDVSTSCGASIRPFGRWYLRYVNQSDWNMDHLTCAAAAMYNTFAVDADAIRRHPESLYWAMLEEVENCRGFADNAAGRYVERSWSALFSDSCHRDEAKVNLEGLQSRRSQAAMLVAPRGAQLSQQAPSSPRTLDLVVATYSANLDWVDATLRQMPGARLRLYCKGNVSQDPRCIRMENVGTEEYAYFTHILDNWDNLADITIFTIDNMQNAAHYKPTNWECLQGVVQRFNSAEKQGSFHGYHAVSYFPLSGRYDISKYHASAGEEKVDLCRPSASPYGNWYRRFINPSDPWLRRVNCTTASMHGIFAVTKDRIRRHPKSRYSDLLREVELCRGFNAFVAGHYMERSWAPMFEDVCHFEEAWANLRKSRGPRVAFNSP